MRLFFWFVVGYVHLALITSGLAQDSLTFNATPLTLTPSTVVDVSSAFRWRLSGAMGYHRQVSSGPVNNSLYLTNGFRATVAADYFIGHNWGLGLLLGYQNLFISDKYKRDPGVPTSMNNSPPLFSPFTAFHSFMVAVGPAFSFPLSQRLTFDLDGRVGGFYNDSPLIQIYDANTRDPLLTVTPSNQRLRLGFVGSVGVKYQLTQQFGIGLSGTVNSTSFDYTQVTYGNNTQKRADLTMYGVQATLSYRLFSSPRQRSITTGGPTAVAATVIPKPVCYPPIIDPTQQDEFELGSVRRPVIRWRSSAPIYAEGEQYVFRLYTLPGNKLLHEQTVREPQITWPAQLALPDTSSYYYYSLYTVRTDDYEQTCHSEPVVGTLGFLSSQALAPAQPVTPREPAYAFTLKLYELQPTLILQKAPLKTTPAKVVKRPTKTTRSAKSRQPKPAKSITSPINIVRKDSSQSGAVQSDSLPARPVATDSLRTRLATSDSVRSDSAMADSIRARLIAIDSTQIRPKTAYSARSRSDSMITSMRITPNLLYEEPISQPSFNWSGKVPLPEQPTVYQYVITRSSNRESVQSHYIMVEPDGCFSIITEAMKNKHLRNSIPPTTQPVPESAPPTNKGQP